MAVDSPILPLHTRLAVFREDKARVFRSVAGVLNNRHPAELTGVNARLFEAAGSGAAVLTEDGLAERLGDAASRRAHRDHTYEVRLAELLGKVC